MAELLEAMFRHGEEVPVEVLMPLGCRGAGGRVDISRVEELSHRCSDGVQARANLRPDVGRVRRCHCSERCRFATITVSSRHCLEPCC